MFESKLHIPALAQSIIPRAELIETLEQQIIWHKLCLVSAPAGYGKTTLLAAWARASSLPVAWLTASTAEDDLENFLRHLLAAWKTVQAEILDSPPGILLESRAVDTQAVLSAFVQAASQAPQDLVFVIDDYHRLQDLAIHAAVAFLLAHLPPNFHFILTTRSDPPLPLARYRARRQLLELRAGDLRFTPSESQEFLTRSMELGLSPDQTAAVHEMTEGWPAGLLLAALSLRHRDLHTREAPLISGNQRFIADFLAEEVLRQLPDDQRNFLFKTSFLDRLCGSLAEAVVGVEDGQAMLEALERDNLFLIALDDRREWFRYHSLFADFLQGELQRRQPGEVHRLHQRTAQWYLDHDFPQQAFQHAVAGRAPNLVLRILERYLIAKLLGGEIKVVQQWLAALPEDWHSQYPLIVIAQASVLLISGQFDACARRLDEAEQLALKLEEEETPLHLARVTALRCSFACFQNDLPRAEEFAAQALRGLPQGDLDFRAGIYGALGDTYRRNGRWSEAKAAYLELLHFKHTHLFAVQAAHTYGALADLALRQGRLRDAHDSWSKALQAIHEPKNWGHLPLPVTGWVYIRLAELLYEWNRLPEAWQHLKKGMERAELGGDVRSLIAGHLLSGRMKLTQGDIAAAVEDLERARPYVQEAQFSLWHGRFERLQVDLRLAQDQTQAALDGYDRRLQGAAWSERPESEAAQLAAARALLAKRDRASLERAHALLERLEQAAEEEGMKGVQVEALALHALGDWQRGERVNALVTLERALRLAEPEGYLRLFVDLGLDMGRLLQEVRTRGILPIYVEKLLKAFAVDLPGSAPPKLPERLTPREEEVLDLVAAGLTNQEIAEKLVISPETVKKHTGRIFGKLGVSNRTEAAARARELDLLN